MTRPRSIPRRLVPVLEELELEQPRIVTTDVLSDIAIDRHVDMSAEEVADRLQRAGWLLSLKTRGAWEFAPASRAGAIGGGDPLIEVRATIAVSNTFAGALAFESAAWLHGLMRHPPSIHAIAVKKRLPKPKALRDFRWVTATWTLPTIPLDGLPTWQVETLVAGMAAHPNKFRDWSNALEWLPEAGLRLREAAMLAELEGHEASTWARTGYLLDRIGLKDAADSVADELPELSGPYYFGPRRTPKATFNARWDVVDSLLPPSTSSDY